MPRRSGTVAPETGAVGERVVQHLGIVGHKDQRRFAEGARVEVDDLFAHRHRRRMLGVPFAPDTVGADVEELHLRSAIISFAQRLEKRTVLLE